MAIEQREILISLLLRLCCFSTRFVLFFCVREDRDFFSLASVLKNNIYRALIPENVSLEPSNETHQNGARACKQREKKQKSVKNNVERIDISIHT